MAQATRSSSIIVLPVGSQTQPTIITRALLAFRRLQISLDDVKDPARLLSLLQRFQENVNIVLRPLTQNPLASINIIQGLVFTGGQTINVQHRLGRAYVGWWCVRAQGNPAVLVEAALPPIATKAQVLPITSTNAGTYDLAVF